MRPCESTRILPRSSFATPSVADCPFAVFGGAGESRRAAAAATAGDGQARLPAQCAGEEGDGPAASHARSFRWMRELSRSEHAIARRRSPLGVTGEIPSRAPWSTHSGEESGLSLVGSWPTRNSRGSVIRAAAAVPSARPLDRLLEAGAPGRAGCWCCAARRGSGRRRCWSTPSERAEGCRVLRAVGVESEMELPFAGLHQLCAPLLDRSRSAAAASA